MPNTVTKSEQVRAVHLQVNKQRSNLSDGVGCVSLAWGESANPRWITKSVQAREANGRDWRWEHKFCISKIYRRPALRVLSHLFITWGSRTHPRLC